MAGFHRVTSHNPVTNLEPSYHAIATGTSLAGGTLAYLNASALAILAVSGSPILGYLEYRGTAVGDSLTDRAFIDDPEMIMEVSQGAMSDADTLTGKYLTLSTGARAVEVPDVGTPVQDFVIVEGSNSKLPKPGMLWVRIIDRQLHS